MEQRKRESLRVAPASVAAIAEHVSILIPVIEPFNAQYRHVFKTLKGVVSQATAAADSKEEKTVALREVCRALG
jgi:hypothetical protein